MDRLLLVRHDGTWTWFGHMEIGMGIWVGRLDQWGFGHMDPGSIGCGRVVLCHHFELQTNISGDKYWVVFLGL